MKMRKRPCSRQQKKRVFNEESHLDIGLSKSGVYTTKIVSNSMTIPIEINRKTEKENVTTPGLLDSRAGGNFIDQNYSRKSGFKIQQLEQPLKAFNVDGTENKCRTIKSFVDLDLTIFGRRRNTRLFVTGLGKQKIILRFPWLNKHNPVIDWKTGDFSWRNSENGKPRLMKINRKQMDNSTWLSLHKKEETTDDSTSMSKKHWWEL